MVARLNTTKALDNYGNATKHNEKKLSREEIDKMLERLADGENTGETAYWSRKRNRCCEYICMDQRKITKKSSYQTRWQLVLINIPSIALACVSRNSQIHKDFLIRYLN